RGLAVVWNSATFELNATGMVPLPHVHNSVLKRRHTSWLRPLRLRPRSALMVEGRMLGRDARLYNIHLSPVGFAFQTAQLTAVLRHAAHREACELLAIVGDFNSLRLDRRKWAAWFAARQAEGFQDASCGVEWTFRSPALPLRQKLDNALVRAPGSLTSCSTLTLAGSDHLPLVTEVGWPEL
ncbi:MAG TPA: hypothetical protein VF157_13745, partial [Chloroflexota bacterium]